MNALSTLCPRVDQFESKWSSVVDQMLFNYKGQYIEIMFDVSV